MKKNLILIAVLLLTVGLGTATALDKGQAPQYDNQSHQLVYHINETLGHLKHHIDLWHDANLKGDREKVSLFEGVIDDIIRDDIAKSKKAVRSFAQLAVLESMSEPSDEDEAEQAKNPIRSNEQFKNMVSNLNSKKKLAEAIGKTKAFSNKYRLLGDYVYLLQQELKIVKVELAEEETDNTESEK